MQIAGYLQTSLIEWPGKIASVVFVPGCNFRCPFCYNRDLVLNSQKLSNIAREKIFADLRGRRKWIDGLVVTGGEPTTQPDLREFLKKVKDLGFLTRIYTNGSNPRLLGHLLREKLLDAITMDIKGPLDGRYSHAAGVPVNLKKVIRSIRMILGAGIESRFVTTVVPRLHKGKDVVDLARSLAKLAQKKEGRKRNFFWTWQQFWPKETCLDPEFERIKPYSKREMKKFLGVVRKIIPKVNLRGD